MIYFVRCIHLTSFLALVSYSVNHQIPTSQPSGFYSGLSSLKTQPFIMKPSAF